MRFGQYLDRARKPEWFERYVDFNRLKFMLDEKQDEKREWDFFRRCGGELRKVVGFMERKMAEIRVRCLLLERAVTVRRKASMKQIDQKRTTKIVSAWTRVREMLGVGRTKPAVELVDETSTQPRSPSAEDQRRLKNACEELFFEVECMDRFKIDNAEGFRKIMKRHDKLYKKEWGAKWRDSQIMPSILVTDAGIEELRERVVEVRMKLTGGSRERALKYLRVPTAEERAKRTTSVWRTVYVVLFVVTLLCAVIRLAFYSDWWTPKWVMIRLFRGQMIALYHITAVAINMHLWRTMGVNYVLIFELDPRKHLTSGNVLMIVALCWALWSMFLLGSSVAPWLNISRLWFPLALNVIYAVLLFNPFHCAYRASRLWILQRYARLIGAPLVNGVFTEFWLASNMNSLSSILLDTQYLVCFYARQVRMQNGQLYFKVNNAPEWNETNTTSLQEMVYDEKWGIDVNTGADFCSSDFYGIRPILSALAAMIRVCQCFRQFIRTKKMFPNFYNTLKYSTIPLTAVFRALYKSERSRMPKGSSAYHSPYFHASIIFAAIRIYASYLWDTRVDWKLFGRRPGKHKILRARLIYRRPWLYYACFAANGCFRSLWIWRECLGHSNLDQAWAQTESINTIVGVLNSTRRFMWNVFRLENEQMNNVEGLRITRKMYAVPARRLRDLGVFRKGMKDTTEGKRTTTTNTMKSEKTSKVTV